MYWRLVAVVLISLVLLVVCYLTLDRGEGVQRYFKYGQKNTEISVEHKPVGLTQNKFKMSFQKEEDFKNAINRIKTQLGLPDDYIAYYFPVKCPDYKLEFYIMDIEYGLEKYYVPEEGHLILVGKDHIWTKEPDFVYWKSDWKTGVIAEQ